MTDPDRLRTVVRQFDRQSEVMPRVKWFADAERARGLLTSARLKPGERVIEVGCGPGFVLTEAGIASRLVGIDVSMKMLRAARERTPNAHVIRAVVEDLPLRDGTFDLAYCRSVLHHVVDPASMVHEMARVVRGGGRVVVNDSVSSEDPRQAKNHNRMESLRDPSHGRMLPPTELVGLLRETGLQIVEVRAHRYRRDLEEFLDITAPTAPTRTEILELFHTWVGHDESGLFVRRERGRIVFDHTQWTLLGMKP